MREACAGAEASALRRHSTAAGSDDRSNSASAHSTTSRSASSAATERNREPGDVRDETESGGRSSGATSRDVSDETPHRRAVNRYSSAGRRTRSGSQSHRPTARGQRGTASAVRVTRHETQARAPRAALRRMPPRSCASALRAASRISRCGETSTLHEQDVYGQSHPRGDAAARANHQNRVEPHHGKGDRFAVTNPSIAISACGVDSLNPERAEFLRCRGRAGTGSDGTRSDAHASAGGRRRLQAKAPLEPVEQTESFFFRAVE